MRGREGKRQGRGKKSNTQKNVLIKHLLDSPICAKPSERGPLWEGGGGGERGRDWEVVGAEKRKEEEMEAWCPRQQVPGIVLGGKCIIMKAGVGRKSTANAKSPRKQLKCHCFSQPAQIPDNFFFYFTLSVFTPLFKWYSLLAVFFFDSLSEGFSDWYAPGLTLLIRCVCLQRYHSSTSLLFYPSA